MNNNDHDGNLQHLQGQVNPAKRRLFRIYLATIVGLGALQLAVIIESRSLPLSDGVDHWIVKGLGVLELLTLPFYYFKTQKL